MARNRSTYWKCLVEFLRLRLRANDRILIATVVCSVIPICKNGRAESTQRPSDPSARSYVTATSRVNI